MTDNAKMIREEIDELKLEIDNWKGEINFIEGEIDYLYCKQEDYQEDIENNLEKISVLEEKLEKIMSDVEPIKGQIVIEEWIN